jgi:hypothetical protein
VCDQAIDSLLGLIADAPGSTARDAIKALVRPIRPSPHTGYARTVRGCCLRRCGSPLPTTANRTPTEWFESRRAPSRSMDRGVPSEPIAQVAARWQGCSSSGSLGTPLARSERQPGTSLVGGGVGVVLGVLVGVIVDGVVRPFGAGLLRRGPLDSRPTGLAPTRESTPHVAARWQGCRSPEAWATYLPDVKGSRAPGGWATSGGPMAKRAVTVTDRIHGPRLAHRRPTTGVAGSNWKPAPVVLSGSRPG